MAEQTLNSQQLNGQSEQGQPIDQTAIDEAKSAAFAGRMLTIFNDGALSLMTSIGHRTGLFDTLVDLPASTGPEIAQAAGLNERYVREWLATMVTGRIVDYDPTTQRYWLPAEHGHWLTRKDPIKNLAITAQFIPVLAEVEEGIIEAFRQGGGVHYHAYSRFHEVMAETSEQSVVAALDEVILPLVPGLVARLEQGIDVLDVGCGMGRALVRMAQRFPNSRFTGYDFEADALQAAQDAANAAGLRNVRFVVQDAAKIEDVDRYDLICTFDAIHDQADPAQVLANIARALRPDGVYLMQDIRASSYLHLNMEHPAAPLLYATSAMHCMTVSLAQGGIGLGTMWGEELAVSMLKEAGFDQVVVEQPPHDILNNFYISRLPVTAAAAAPEGAATSAPTPHYFVRSVLR